MRRRDIRTSMSIGRSTATNRWIPAKANIQSVPDEEEHPLIAANSKNSTERSDQEMIIPNDIQPINKYIGPAVEGGHQEYVKVIGGKAQYKKPTFA